MKKNIKSIKWRQQAQANGLSTTKTKDGDQFSADNWVVSLPKRLKECVENQAKRRKFSLEKGSAVMYGEKEFFLFAYTNYVLSLG